MGGPVWAMGDTCPWRCHHRLTGLHLLKAGGEVRSWASVATFHLAEGLPCVVFGRG